MKTFIFSVTIVLWAIPAFADGIFVEGGPGLFKSRDSTAVLVRYEKDARIFNHDGYYQGVFAHWDNSEHGTVIGLAPGIRWKSDGNRYRNGSFGLCYLNRETGHLGTHFQFFFRVAYGVKVGHYDFSLGLVHVSNGKLVFGWHGPNSGENFATLAIGLF